MFARLLYCKNVLRWHGIQWRNVRMWFDENRSAGSEVEMTRTHTTSRVQMLFGLRDMHLFKIT
jgi:hypothetical protein